MDRMEHVAELTAELESVLQERSTDEWVEALLAEGIPCGPIYNYREVFEDPHTRAREMMVEMEHPVEGKVRGLGIPVKLSEIPGRIRRPAPLIGQRTDEVLGGLGYSETEIFGLRERG